MARPGVVLGVFSIALFLHATPVSPSLGDRLHAAVRAGSVAEIRQALAAGADVNARDSLGGTPLLEAVLSGNLEITGLLLTGGADINARHGETGSTALEYAVVRNYAAIVNALLAAKARVDFRYKDGQTALHAAAVKGNRDIVASLIGAGAVIDAVDDHGNTPLDEAVLHGRGDTMAALLARGANIRRVHPGDGRGPLHEAAIKGFATLAKPLCDAGANPAQRDRSGQTPLDLALDYKNGPMVAVLLRLGDSAIAQEAMETATLRGRTEIARLLIDNGFDINDPTPAGSTYLSDAALKGQAKMVALLLARGARIEARGSNADNPLHDAALGGNPEVITLLLDYGAAIDAPDRESGATPLMIAASLGRASAVEVLLRRGANPLLRDHAGHTALDRAREAHNGEVVKLLPKG
jgi:uncharacterized protein